MHPFWQRPISEQPAWRMFYRTCDACAAPGSWCRPPWSWHRRPPRTPKAQQQGQGTRPRWTRTQRYGSESSLHELLMVSARRPFLLGAATSPHDPYSVGTRTRPKVQRGTGNFPALTLRHEMVTNAQRAPALSFQMPAAPRWRTAWRQSRLSACVQAACTPAARPPARTLSLIHI